MQRTVRCSELRREGGRGQRARSAISPETGLEAKPIVRLNDVRIPFSHQSLSLSLSLGCQLAMLRF